MLKGYKMSEEHKIKIGLANKGIQCIKICKYCKKEFTIRLTLDYRIYCSQDCYSNSNIGKIPWNKGKIGVVSEENRKIHSNFMKLRIGKDSPNWKGGITPTLKRLRLNSKTKEWRTLIFQRDNYTCQMEKCGERGGKLNAHHIKRFKDFPNIRFDINNGITLCKKCHQKINNKEKMFESFFFNKLNINPCFVI